MIISVHGRRGQGVEKAVDLIGLAAFSSGLRVQSMVFPSASHDAHSWGFVKLEKDNIISKQVEPYDITMIFDTTLDVKSILSYSKDRSIAIFNTAGGIKYPAARKKRIKLFGLDATGVSIQTSNRASPELPMLGALAKNFKRLSLKAIKSAVGEKENLLSIEEGYKSVRAIRSR